MPEPTEGAKQPSSAETSPEFLEESAEVISPEPTGTVEKQLGVAPDNEYPEERKELWAWDAEVYWPDLRDKGENDIDRVVFQFNDKSVVFDKKFSEEG